MPVVLTEAGAEPFCLCLPLQVARAHEHVQEGTSAVVDAKVHKKS